MHQGPREGPVIALFLVLTLAASAFVLHRAEANTVKDPKQKAARGEIQGLSELSLVRPENLTRALAKIGASKWPLIWNIRIAPDRVNASVRDRDGYRRFMTIDPAFGVSSVDANVGEDYAVQSSAIDVQAPKRMLDTVVARTGLSPSALDYLAMSASKDTPASWYMSMKQGPARVRQWIADEHGRDVRKPGEPSAADKKRNAAEARRQARIQLILQRRARCVARAHDANAVSRCLDKYQP